jgi:hypothetical protein
MPNGPPQNHSHQCGRYDYAEVELGGTLQIVGPNKHGQNFADQHAPVSLSRRPPTDGFRPLGGGNNGITTFQNQYSYVLFECLGVGRGKFVLGWRGQSKAAGGEPERFYYEGEYAASDFIAEQDQVREPRAINAKLSSKNYKALKSARIIASFCCRRPRVKATGLASLRCGTTTSIHSSAKS